MNIVFISVGVLSSKSHALGVPYAVGLGKALIAKGHNLTIVTSKAGEAHFKNLGLDAEFWLVDAQGELAGAKLMRVIIIMMKRMFRACSLLRKKEFEQDTVIFALSNLLWETFPLLFVKGKPVIRISAFHRNPNNPFKRRKGAAAGKQKPPFMREALVYLQHELALPCIKYGSDIIIAQTNVAHHLRNIGIPQEKIADMDVGVDWDIINSVVAPAKRRYDACWGKRYDSQIADDDLLEIWETVVQARKNARLAVMGSVEPRLKPVTEQKKLENNVEFPGPVSEELKYRVMKESSLFLFPGYYEAAPLVAIEAMACGLPVVAYDLPVYQNYFPRGMVKVPAGDKQAFARAVIDILDDNDKRRRLADEAAALASGYNWDKAADNFLAEASRDRFPL